MLYKIHRTQYLSAGENTYKITTAGSNVCNITGAS
jgi:hypothetical protein